MEKLDYWRLCDELSIEQAAQLIIGLSPGWREAIEEEGGELTAQSAVRYRSDLMAATTAITNAVRARRLVAAIQYEIMDTYDGVSDQMFPNSEGDIDVTRTTILVDDLRAWLASRGFRSGFFFPTAANAPDYLDPTHPRYAPKLAAAVRAWLATEDESATRGKSAKQALGKWLREHASEFKLSDEEGKPNETGIEECAKVANWQDKGGAPKTPGG